MIETIEVPDYQDFDLLEEYGEDELLRATARNLNLHRPNWEFKRGAKTERLYHTKEKDSEGNDYKKTHVRPYYQYEYKLEDNPLEEREISKITEYIEWISQGQVFKTRQIKEILPSDKLDEINEEARERQIRHLRRKGEELKVAYDSLPFPVDQPTVDYLNSLSVLPPGVSTVEQYTGFRDSLLELYNSLKEMFLDYDPLVHLYTLYGYRDFENKVIEDNSYSVDIATIMAIVDEDERNIELAKYKRKQLLSFLAYNPDAEFPNGLTVFDSIIYQLTGIKP